MNRKGKKNGFLLVEVIVGLSIFAIVVGVITQGFLVGLKLYREADEDPNEAVFTVMLINQLRKNPGSGSLVKNEVEFSFSANESSSFQCEKWRLEAKNLKKVSEISPNLYAMDITVKKLTDAKGNKAKNRDGSSDWTPKSYHIFRHFKS